MKKILTTLLSIALLFTLCACNSTEFSSTTPYTFGNVTFQIPTSWGEPTENEDSTDTHFFIRKVKERTILFRQCL